LGGEVRVNQKKLSSCAKRRGGRSVAQNKEGGVKVSSDDTLGKFEEKEEPFALESSQRKEILSLKGINKRKRIATWKKRLKMVLYSPSGES